MARGVQGVVSRSSELMTSSRGGERSGESVKLVRTTNPISVHRRPTAAVCAAFALIAAAHSVWADEGGVSFWLPGQYGSLAAVPQEPGVSLPLIYIHTFADAGRDKSFPLSGRLAAGLDVTTNLLVAYPTFTFPGELLGGRPAVSMGIIFGSPDVSVDATFTGPLGNTRTAGSGDSITAFGDLYPQASLRWNFGRHNAMAYLMGGIPVGAYQVGRLANLGTNHWSLDIGGAYTYLDTKHGQELSVTLGATYNFENPATNYRNGIDSHLDWGLSQFFSEHLHVGAVGYLFYQLTGDSGSGARLGDFKSHVVGVGPQVGYSFVTGKRTWYANLKAYGEFAADHRPDGWNLWVTFVVPVWPMPPPSEGAPNQ
jgi:hypothetical protein